MPTDPANAASPLLSVRDLAVSFAIGLARNPAQRLQAVDGVSMTIYPRQTLAVVGESGCGKSVTAMSLMHLLPKPPAHIDRGSAMFQTTSGSRDLLAMSERDIRQIRGGEIAMIFQEPMSSLNPVFTIGDQIIEAITLHQSVRHREATEIAVESLHAVGITDPQSRLRAYPHQFSGGMRQRVMIAMALACRPKLLLADEPTTALDVTIQQQILQLLGNLKQQRGMAIMLITHDLGVVAENADVVCVMYAGRVVEYASVQDLFDNPLHPYTRGLLACIPKLGNKQERLTTISEIIDQPGAFAPPPGSPPDVRPWWPRHQPPAPLATRNHPSGDSILHEIAPDHWIALWRTESLAQAASRPPDLNSHASVDSPAVFNTGGA